MCWLTWNDLNDLEKEQAIESYCYIRECEEEKPHSKDKAIKNVVNCRFERINNYIYVDL